MQVYYDNSHDKGIICDMPAGEDARLFLSQYHALGIPFYTMVDGIETDVNVRISKEAARKTGFGLVVKPPI